MWLWAAPPLAAMSRQVLAQNVALVPQTPFLIADTIYHNICYGLSGEIPLADVQQAARKANIAADIEKLPGTYRFVLSEGGAICPADSGSALHWPASFCGNPKF